MALYPFYQVDAFSTIAFKGNPAAVMILPEWLSNAVLQEIASENNLSETAFLVKHDDDYEIRWFTPSCEVNLCGHATLAAAHIVYSEYFHEHPLIHFHTKVSGTLIVKEVSKGKYAMDFPIDTISPFVLSKGKMENALNCEIDEVVQGQEDILVVLKNKDLVTHLNVNLSILAEFPYRGCIVCAIDENKHVYSRWFGPRVGVNEDPVTGSAHTTLAAYWQQKLGISHFFATQLSKRTGFLELEITGNRVSIIGNAKKVIHGLFEV